MQDPRVLLAENRYLVELGLRTAMSGKPVKPWVDYAPTTKELLTKLTSNRYDLIILGLPLFLELNKSMYSPVYNLTRKISTILIGQSLDRAELEIGKKFDPHAYVLPECGQSELCMAVEAAMKKTKYYCGKVLESMNHIQNQDESNSTADLSQRELEIIQLIVEEKTASEIAECLFLSEHTVRTHRRNIMQKIGVKNTAGLVMYAVKSGLILSE